MQSPASALTGPLRDTPWRFRLFALVSTVVVIVGYATLLWFAPAPGLPEMITSPGFVLLALLMLLADLYPLVPWMRDVRANVTFAWSAALSLAAVLAYGPEAAVLFLVSGLTAALSRRTGRWWRPLINMVVFGLIGLAVAGLSALGPSGNPPPPMDPISLLVWGLGLAVVTVVLNALLIGLALVTLGATTWFDQWERFDKAVRIWGVSLITAPLLAALALDGPWALPSMAVVIVSLNNLSGTLFRSTQQARIDTLTGLANRLTLIRRLSARLARIGARDPGIVLLLIDLDDFKDVNDTYGHLVGDEVLIAVAHRLQATVGPADLVARYGGDEFAVVLGPGATVESAEALAAALGETLAEPLIAHEISVRIGGSIGIATTDDPRVDVLGLVEQADRDMYRAKWARDGATVPDRRGAAAPPRPAVSRPPTWSMSVQGSSSWPAAGWPGVQWSASPGVGPTVVGTPLAGARARLDTR